MRLIGKPGPFGMARSRRSGLAFAATLAGATLCGLVLTLLPQLCLAPWLPADPQAGSAVQAREHQPPDAASDQKECARPNSKPCESAPATAPPSLTLLRPPTMNLALPRLAMVAQVPYRAVRLDRL